jgi:two-component system chemotaxis response regulator CheY
MPLTRVLVVESDKTVRQFMNETLTQKGYEVVEADTVEDGIKCMHPRKGQLPIDVVLCNRQTASTTDQDPLVQFLMHRPPVPVVMVADHPDLHYATQMFRQGVVDYLVKPIQPNALLDVVRHAIKLSAGHK